MDSASGRFPSEDAGLSGRKNSNAYFFHMISSSDPFAGLVGLAGDIEGPVDVAENHDRYLYRSGRSA